MKIYIAEHPGVYIDGVSVVSASSSRKAKEIVREAINFRLQRKGKNVKISDIRVREFTADVENIAILSDGDY